MKLKKISLLVVIVIVVIIGSLLYFNEGETYIEGQIWKYNDGSHIGDVLNFKNEYLEGKYIYRNDKVIAKVIFCTKETLVLRSYENGEKGYYSKIEL